MKKLLLISLLQLTNIHTSVKYHNLIQNVNFDNYPEKIKQYESYKKNTPTYWYYYGVLYKKIILLNLLSNKLDNLIEEMKSKLTKTITFDDKKYKILALNEFIFIYNLFLERGCEYLKIKKYDKAIKSFNIAKSFFNNIEIDIKIAFAKQLEKKYDESINIYNTCKESTKDNNTINKININLIEIYMIKKNFDQVKEILKSEFEKNNCNIQLLEILSRLKYKHDTNIEDILSKDEKIYNFQNAVIHYFNRSYEQSFKLLDKLNLKKLDQLILFSDVIYQYTILSQNNSCENNLLISLINKNIRICNKILKIDNKNTEIIKRLINLHIAINDYKNADKIIQTKKINLIY